MCALRERPSVPTWEILSDSSSSSQSDHTSPSDSERMDTAPINSKRKAPLSSPGSQRPHKSARTDASHSPGSAATLSWAAKRTQDAFGSGTGAASPATRKKRKVLLTRNGELLHSLRKLKSGADNARRNNDQSLPRNGGSSSEGKSEHSPARRSQNKAENGSQATRIQRTGNPREVIVLLSDDDTPALGNASNPIVLESDNEADPTPAQRGGATAPPSSDSSRSMSQREDIHPVPPSSSNHSHSSQSRRSPPVVANTRNENMPAARETSTSEEDITDNLLSPMQSRTEPPSPETALLPPSDLDSVRPIDELPASSVNTDRMSSPIENGSDVCDKVLSPGSRPMRCGSPPVPSSVSPISPKPQTMEISPESPESGMEHMSSFPNRDHDLPTNASANVSPVRVRGTLYSGPSGLWKDFYRVAAGEQASPSKSSRGIEEQDDTRSKTELNTPRANSSRNVSSSALVSLARNMSISTSPKRSIVAARESSEITDELTITTPDSVSSVAADASSFQAADLFVVQFTPARTMLEFGPRPLYSRDIPHSLQDLMNTVEATYRKSNTAKEMFEAVIYENTYDDEPNAPPISIINDADEDDVTPAWEFHYSNRIWHSDGVPPPDLDNLRGCDCQGYCDPKSQTCSCLKRQHEYSGDIPGFIYDDKGRLKQRGFPIFECNDLCGCLDGCRNRVVQRGRQYAVNIRKTTNKGWGIFAGRQKIPKGSFIGVYAGELLTENEGEERGIKYNKFGRTYLFQIDFYHLRPTENNPNGDDDEEWQTKYVVDAYHAGNFTRFLNHSCDPNCAMNASYINEANLDKPLLALFTRRDVLPWEELSFSYTGYDSDEEEDEEAPANNNNGDAVYAECLCGAKNCKGYMFK